MLFHYWNMTIWRGQEDDTSTSPTIHLKENIFFSSFQVSFVQQADIEQIDWRLMFLKTLMLMLVSTSIPEFAKQLITHFQKFIQASHSGIELMQNNNKLFLNLNSQTCSVFIRWGRLWIFIFIPDNFPAKKTNYQAEEIIDNSTMLKVWLYSVKSQKFQEQ